MGELLDELGGRNEGELVRSADWNALVAATDALTQRVEEGFDALRARLDDVDTRLDAVGARINDLDERHTGLQAAVEALEDRHRLVDLSSPRTTYAVGQRAEIVARVTDENGDPPSSPRPWVDFVTQWGRLTPVGGPSLAGAEGRSISVQVDADGVARARLAAGSVEGVPDDVQDEFEASLTTRPSGTTVTLAESILAANTPAEAASNGFFEVATSAYMRTSDPGVTTFADHYYLHNPSLVATPLLPVTTTRWRDHRATVLAIVKPDPDPVSPDAGLGVSSIQVTFRDWLAPWIVLDVLRPLGPSSSVRDVVGRFFGPTLADSLRRVDVSVKEQVTGRGVLGKMRVYREFELALDELQPTEGPAFLEDLVTTTRHGLAVQRALEPAQATGALDGGDTPGVAAFASTAAMARGGVDQLAADVLAVNDAIDRVGVEAAATSAEVEQVRQNVTNLDGKVTATIDEQVRPLADQVSGLDASVQQVSRLYPEPVRETLVNVQSQLAAFTDIQRRLDFLERG